MKTLTLVADDFGMAPAIDRGIVALACAQRLSAVSCSVTSPAWATHWSALAATGVRCGLHLNLTEGRPLSVSLAAVWPQLPGLPRLVALSHLRALPLRALQEEFDAQWAAFVAVAGCTPCHVDGHQHVHHLPGVRELVLRACVAHPALRVRATGRVCGAGFGLKRRLIASTGGAVMARRLQQLGQAANTSLWGVYDFGHADDTVLHYRALMRRWLKALPAKGALLFCHPGDAPRTGEQAARDPIAAARQGELAYLDSPAFAADLQAAEVVVHGAAQG